MKTMSTNVFENSTLQEIIDLVDQILTENTLEKEKEAGSVDTINTEKTDDEII